MAEKRSRDSGRYYVVTQDAIDALAAVLFGDDATESFSDAGTARKVQGEMAQRGEASVLVHLPTGAQVAPKKVERLPIESKDFERV